METKELGKQLGISHQMANRLKKRGMPTDSLEAAKEWRHQNLDVTQTKGWRIQGNSGKKRETTPKNEPVEELIKATQIDALTKLLPELWFSEIGWLGAALRDNGVSISAKTLLKIQSRLFMLYMGEIDEVLEIEATYRMPECLMIQPDSPEYPSLVKKLNQILEAEPTP